MAIEGKKGIKDFQEDYGRAMSFRQFRYLLCIHSELLKAMARR